MAEIIISNPTVTINTNSTVKPEDMYQVILWNDDYVEGFFVARCLTQVFGHDRQLAIKIMMEAHTGGKAIAEVEGAESAGLHSKQLQSFGITATVEKI